MTLNKEVVYPSIASFNSNLLLSFGPYDSGTVVKLFRAEVRGKINYQGELIGSTTVEANFQVWGLQWVSHGSAALDPVTSTDDDHWLIREQVIGGTTRAVWSNATTDAYSLKGDTISADWSGQLLVSDHIDLYLVMRAPTGVTIDNMNFFGTIRWWWSS